MRNARSLAEGSAALALGSVPVVALGFADGGFFPRPWGWAALGLASCAIVLVLARRTVVVSPRALFLVGLLAALGIWMVASLAWTRSTALSVPELQRMLVYLTGVGAAALLVRARSARSLVLGVFSGASAVVVWGLVSYLLTREHTLDVFQGAYLHRPLGYANAMAVMAALAFLLGLGIVADDSRRAVRVVAGTALVPLAAALTLTGSRASCGALVVGAVVAGALTGDVGSTVRTWAAIVVVPVVTAILVSAVGLPSSQLVGEQADRAGKRVLAVVLLLSILATWPAFIASSWSAAAGARRDTRWLAVAALSVASLLVVTIPSLSGFGGERPAYWTAALGEARERPLHGSGAGTYAQTWLERRPLATTVRDAHSLPIEALSELGIIGLALVVLVLAAPLAWGMRARGRPLVPAVTGTFAAYAVHATVDWDWELPAITLAALFLATALAASADERRSLHITGAGPRGALLGLFAIAAALGAVGLIGSTATEDASRALARGDSSAAVRAAATADRWQPWSVEPLLVRGRASLLLGDVQTARVAFARAVARDPNDYRAWLALAGVSHGDAAEASLLRATALNPRVLRGTLSAP